MRARRSSTLTFCALLVLSMSAVPVGAQAMFTGGAFYVPGAVWKLREGYPKPDGNLLWHHQNTQNRIQDGKIVCHTSSGVVMTWSYSVPPDLLVVGRTYKLEIRGVSTSHPGPPNAVLAASIWAGQNVTSLHDGPGIYRQGNGSIGVIPPPARDDWPKPTSDEISFVFRPEAAKYAISVSFQVDGNPLLVYEYEPHLAGNGIVADVVGERDAQAQAQATDAELGLLRDDFAAMVRQRISEGYFVKNDSWLRGLRHMIQDRTRAADSARGGRCGEFGEWGMNWSRDFVERRFGPGAIVDDIVMQERTSRNGDGWLDPQTWNPDKIYEANHRATRVILPDGRRYVLDYWEAVSTGSAVLQTEQDWTSKWYRRISGWQPGDAVVDRSDDEMTLRNFVATYGTEKGLALFRSRNARDLRPRPAGQINTLIRSWQADPW